MGRVPYFIARRWSPGLILTLAAAVLGCPLDSTGTGDKNYTLNWIFVNNESSSSIYDAVFLGRDLASNASVRRFPDDDGGTETGTTVSIYKSGTIQVLVQVEGALGAVRKAVTSTVPVEPDKATTITALWDGFTLLVSATVGAAPTWKLVGPNTGDASGSWQDIGGSASGTLSGFNPPTEVEEGKTYTISATFSGSATAAAGWDGIKRNIQVAIQDYDTYPGLSQQYTVKQVTVTGTISDAVTVTAAWSPRPATPNTTTFTLQAAGTWGMGGSTPTLVATYSKVP